MSYSPEQLASMPVRDGFRQRGEDMTRLETFTDAAFAFAVTLLVVGGGDSIPSDFDEMIVNRDLDEAVRQTCRLIDARR